MKCKLIFFLLLVVAGAGLLVSACAFEQITFAQNPARAQDPPANQQNLPPEKKKSLSGLGPDELFTNERESRRPAERPRRSSRRARRSSSTSPRPTPTPAPTPAAAALKPDNPAAAPPVAPERPAVKTAPTTAPLSISTEPALPPNRLIGVGTTLVHLSLWIMTFTTLGLLVFVLSRLRVLLSES